MTNQAAQATDPRLDLVERLGKTIVSLSASTHITSACERFNEAVEHSDGAPSVDATKEFKNALEPLTTLVRAANLIHPHTLTADELKGLGDSPTDKLVKAALTQGALRERRMLLQAAEANTHRRIAWYAIAAIVINACATLVAAVI